MKDIRPMKLLSSFLIFFIFGVIFAFNIYFLIPFVIEVTGVNPFIVAQIVNTALLFIPIFFTALFLLKSEGAEINWFIIKERFNFQKPALKDFYWMFGSLFIAVIITGLLVLILDILPIPFDLTSIEEISPITLKPLQGYELLFILFMPISFFFNYVGEEVLWRGYIYPRQELTFGKKTWIINGILHGVFHLYMGISIIPFLPILLAMPYVYSKTKNIYIIILMHALLGAPADLLLAIGIVT